MHFEWHQPLQTLQILQLQIFVVKYFVIFRNYTEIMEILATKSSLRYP